MTPYSLPARAPRSLWLLAVLAAIIGLSHSPTTLIALGPLRVSLTSDNPLTRQTAEMTVLVGRLACGLFALLVASLAWRWGRVTQSRFMQAVVQHAVPVSELRRAAQRTSGVAVLAWTGGAAAVLYMVAVEGLLPASVRSAMGKEDGVFEQGTALMFLGAGLVGVIAVLGERRFANATRGSLREALRRKVVWSTLLVAFFFVAAGEEISWGQRMFGFATPEAMNEINVQSETNLHNMMGYLADHLFILGVMVYGAALPLLAARFDFWRRLLHWMGLPLASTGLAIGFLIASTIHRFTLAGLMPVPPEVRVAELREFVTSMCFLLLAIEQVRIAKARGIPSEREAQAVAA